MVEGRGGLTCCSCQPPSGVFSSHQVTLTTQGGDSQSDWVYFSRPESTPPTDSILSNNTQKNEPGSEMVTGMTGCDLGLTGDCANCGQTCGRYSSNVCPGCGDEKCDPGFARTPYKHRTPCGSLIIEYQKY